ncbi:RNA recognition motif-containing protein 20 [Elsinoe fawcettii]|nr:RNA recognition motif-containing protein 20 [Elsinoe fawcettii]
MDGFSIDDVEKLLEEGRENAKRIEGQQKSHGSPKDKASSNYNPYRDEEALSRRGSHDSRMSKNDDKRSAHDSDRPARRHTDRYSGGRRRSRSPRSPRNGGRDSYDRYDGRARHDGRGDRYRDRSPDDDRHRRSPRDRDDRRGGGRDRRRDSPRRRARIPTPEPTDDERDRRTVFVQQLANRLRTRELEAFFEKIGPVKEAQIVRDRVTNRSKGVGYVEFKDEESVAKALDLTGQQLLGIPIIVQLTEAEKNRQARQTEGQATLSNGAPFHRLYVGNVHFSVGESDLQTLFGTYGEVEVVQLQKDESGRSRGYGFVLYANSDDAKQALAELNGFMLADRPLRVGLGNDKMNAEATTGMMQRNAAPGSEFQASSFSGAGGRGTHAGGSTNFERTNREEKAAANSSALDDSDVGGVNYSNFSRDSLMKKLARIEEPAPEKSKTKATAVKNKPAPPTMGKSRCIVVKNCYDESDFDDANFQQELEEDFKEECSEKYGEVVHIGVPSEHSEGAVFVKFRDLAGGDNALKGLNGRFFAGKVLTAAPIVDAIYNTNFPKASGL